MRKIYFGSLSPFSFNIFFSLFPSKEIEKRMLFIMNLEEKLINKRHSIKRQQISQYSKFKFHLPPPVSQRIIASSEIADLLSLELQLTYAQRFFSPSDWYDFIGLMYKQSSKLKFMSKIYLLLLSYLLRKR